MSDVTSPHMEVRFKGGKQPLSNLFVIEAGLQVFGEVFRSSEHAYQWIKAKVAQDGKCGRKILRVKSPYTAMFV